MERLTRKVLFEKMDTLYKFYDTIWSKNVKDPDWELLESDFNYLKNILLRHEKQYAKMKGWAEKFEQFKEIWDAIEKKNIKVD